MTSPAGINWGSLLVFSKGQNQVVKLDSYMEDLAKNILAWSFELLAEFIFLC